jgi:hypothetical protein
MVGVDSITYGTVIYMIFMMDMMSGDHTSPLIMSIIKII